MIQLGSAVLGALIYTGFQHLGRKRKLDKSLLLEGFMFVVFHFVAVLVYDAVFGIEHWGWGSVKSFFSRPFQSSSYSTPGGGARAGATAGAMFGGPVGALFGTMIGTHIASRRM